MRIENHFRLSYLSVLIISILTLSVQSCGFEQSGFDIVLQATATGDNFIPSSTIVPTKNSEPVFSGERAFQHIAIQLGFGPRTLGSKGHEMVVSWMVDELTRSDWDVFIQEHTYNDEKIRNVIARRGTGLPWIILGAHYDTRFFADRDPDPKKRTQPVPGANDGASGVAVLLELARVLPEQLPGEIWLVFFDAEDNGDIPGWDWILGSQLFVEDLEGQPEAVVIIDMIGDANQEIYWEKNSDPVLTREIWDVADQLGYADQFVPRPGYRILDDHLPFLRAGIPAVDIIDFDYSAWHTTDDTIDKISSKSLKIVGDVLMHWLFLKMESVTSK